MDRDAAREYARRDWVALDHLRLRERPSRFRKGGSAASIRAGRRLWALVRGIRGTLSSQRGRAADLAHHVELKRRLDRAARAFRIR
jgi:hypothetical protein